MRSLKWILLALLLAAAFGYGMVNHEYRAIKHQYMYQQSAEGKLHHMFDWPSSLSEQLPDAISSLQRWIPIGHEEMNLQEDSLKKQKSTLAYWLRLFRWTIFITAGAIFFIMMFSGEYSHAVGWGCTFVLLLLGISTPFLSIVVETGKLHVPHIARIDSIVFYYKAKSVLGVMYSLIKTSRAYEMILGMLLGIFSFVAPMVKLFVVPLLPASPLKANLQYVLWRFAWVDVLTTCIIVSFLATDQLLVKAAGSSFLFTGHSQLEDGAIFFLMYLAFAAIGMKKHS